MKSFAQGIQETGDRVEFLEDVSENIDVAVIWSMLWTNPVRKKIYYSFKRQGTPVIVLEVGGIIRNKTWKVALDGINAQAFFNNSTHIPSREQKFDLNLKPWQPENKNIVICGQHELSAAWRWGSTEEWLGNLINEIRNHTNKTIIFRPHPRFSVSLRKKLDCETQKPVFQGNYDCFDLGETLKSTHLLISYNSNPAIEAVINGVPVYTDETSLCYPVSIKNFKYLNNPPQPDRQKWFKDIIHTEWFEDEIKQGIPYKRLREFL